jgi:hypothetical protein
MNCKKIYLGQEIVSDNWNYGFGSVYLCGSRNPKRKSWRLDLISKLEDSGTPMTIFIPETKNQLNGGYNKESKNSVFDWQRSAMAMSTAIIFWYPKDVHDNQSCAEFGLWHKSERIFLGREPGAQTEYLEWLFYKEQLLYPADTLDQVAEMFLHWIKE